MTERKALKNVINICARKINATMIPILNSSLDFFWRVLLLFSMILVSTPVYTTTPVTHSVILRLHPLSTTLLLSSGTPFHEPVKVWMKGLGRSYLNYSRDAYRAFSYGPLSYFINEPNSYFTCFSLRLVSPSKFIVSM